jgi:carboxyl-terminal processing protease
MFMRKLWVLSVTMLLVIAACEKTGTAPIVASNYPINNYNDVFEAFWNGMNTRYVFWEYDTTNWDNIYKTYKPLFASLDTQTHVNKDAVAFGYLKMMTRGLIDGHYDLMNININNSLYSFRPSAYRKSTDAYFLANPQIGVPYFNSILPKRLDVPSYRSTDTLLFEGDTVFAVSGTINSNILYLYFKSFHLTRFYSSDASLKKVLDFFQQRLSPDSTQYLGAIIDVRDNYGGEIRDIDFLLGPIVSAPVDFGYSRTKVGNGRLDYTSWIPAIISPVPGSRPLSNTQKIVVLADDWSESAAEQLTMAIKTLPNSSFVGDTTWGANGPFEGSPFYTDFFGGPFNIGITSTGFSSTGTYGFVKTSSSMFKYINGTVYEGRGFPPDILVPQNNPGLHMGVDSQLEAAIRLFK